MIDGFSGLWVDYIDFCGSNCSDPLSGLEFGSVRGWELVPLGLPLTGNHQSAGFGEAVAMTDDESEGFCAAQNGGGRWRSGGEDVDGVAERGGIGEVGEHIEDHRSAAHVGHFVAVDGGVDGGGVKLREADVGSSHGGGPPRVAPPVGVEHG